MSDGSTMNRWSMVRGTEKFVVHYENSSRGIQSLVNAWREYEKRFDWWNEHFTDTLLEAELVQRQIRRHARV